MIEPLTLEALEAELLAGPTATDALRRWCTARSGASGRVSAHRDGGWTLAPGVEITARLACDAGDTIRHRRVELRWGADRLSIADNWYVPQRLTPDMNAQLQSGDTPFGEVVAPLGVVRHTWRSMRQPALSAGAEEGGAGSSAAPSPALRPVLRQDAVLVLAVSGLSLAAVSETYLPSVLEIARRSSGACAQ